MNSLLKKYWPILGIVLLEISLLLTNYKLGTFLLGWDNLYPELNFSVNFKRNVFAIWQEYRGLGLLDGMAHAANLPHTTLFWLLHFFLPLNLLRYSFIFLMHFLSGIGIYFLLERLILKRGLVPFLGALFYLLNLAAIQMFYAPFEVFAVHFAFLPWAVLSLLKYFETPEPRNLLYFILLSILSLPQGFIPQLFLVYLSLVFFILFFFWLKQKAECLKKIALILFIIFAINAFWLLPYLYSVAKNSGIIINAKINQMSSEDVYLKNKARGNLGNVIFLKGFMLDVIELTKSGESDYIMKDWRTHLSNIAFKISSTLFFLVTILGIVRTFLKRKRGLYPFLVSFLVSFLFLASDVPLVEFLNRFLRENLPWFGEAFRFSFTKFSLLFAFNYTIFFCYGLTSLDSLERYFKKEILTKGLFVLFLVSIFFYSYPAFKGNFLFDSLRIKIPQEYFQTIDFFKKENKNTRIATFPQPNFWSWRFLRGGYRGSGFLWQGIGQPTLDRAFDPWNDKNENYYWEISYALYSQNKELFEKVLEKYQINWILVDNNVINPSSPKALYLDELEQILSKSDKVSLSQEFSKIKIYQVDLETPVKDFVFLAKNLLTVGPEYRWNNFDFAYAENRNYLTTVKAPEIYYPFRSLFSGRSQQDLEFEVEDEEFYFIFRRKIPEQLKDFHLEIPEIKKELIWVDPNDLSRIRYLTPEVRFTNDVIEIIVPKVGGYYSAQIEPTKVPEVQIAKNCNQFAKGRVNNEIVEEDGNKFLRLSAIDTNNCSASFWLPNLPHKLSYLITVESRHQKGKSLLFWLENLNARRADIEIYLPKSDSSVSYFIQPPMEEDGLGYTLHFDNISIGRQKTINDLGKITVNPIPFNFLINLRLASPQTKEGSQKQVISIPEKVSHPNPSFYRIEGDFAPNRFLVLSQSFHPGWQAFRVDGFSIKRIKNHVLVNNWVNGWMLEDTRPGTIFLVFVPQFLEYFGFLLLLVPFALLIIF